MSDKYEQEYIINCMTLADEGHMKFAAKFASKKDALLCQYFYNTNKIKPFNGKKIIYTKIGKVRIYIFVHGNINCNENLWIRSEYNRKWLSIHYLKFVTALKKFISLFIQATNIDIIFKACYGGTEYHTGDLFNSLAARCHRTLAMGPNPIFTEMKASITAAMVNLETVCNQYRICEKPEQNIFGKDDPSVKVWYSWSKQGEQVIRSQLPNIGSVAITRIYDQNIFIVFIMWISRFYNRIDAIINSILPTLETKIDTIIQQVVLLSEIEQEKYTALMQMLKGVLQYYKNIQFSLFNTHESLDILSANLYKTAQSLAVSAELPSEFLLALLTDIKDLTFILSTSKWLLDTYLPNNGNKKGKKYVLNVSLIYYYLDQFDMRLQKFALMWDKTSRLYGYKQELLQDMVKLKEHVSSMNLLYQRHITFPNRITKFLRLVTDSNSQATYSLFAPSVPIDYDTWLFESFKK
jgi:hypothetical protein